MTLARTFVKGHGTGNDFILYADVDGQDPLTDDEIVSLANRHTGIGADGVIRAVRTAAVPEVEDQAGAAEWFMDYRNRDASLATMCGNGIRVYVAYLEQYGYLSLEDGDDVKIATRGGTLTVRKELDEYAVDMGRWKWPNGRGVLTKGFDSTVAIQGLEEPRPGLRVDVPNPHTVIALDDLALLDEIDLTREPRVEPEVEGGSNVEIVVPLGEREVDMIDEDGDVVGTEKVGVVKMRVYERGAGETMSCGTGACAAAIATKQWFGTGAPKDWVVLVPGGQLRVTIRPGNKVELTGPAELVAEITLLG